MLAPATVIVPSDAHDRVLANALREPDCCCRPGTSRRLIVDVRTDLPHGTQQAAQPRMEEPQHRYSLVHAVRCDDANAIHGRHARLTVIMYDDRNIESQIAPGSREQYVLYGFAADVAVRAVARQHGVVLEPDDADLRYCHTSEISNMCATHNLRTLARALVGARALVNIALREL